MASHHVSRGAFIVLEGVDRCGKTTQCSMLLEYLQKKQIPVELWRFPDRTATTGATINSYLAGGTNLSDEAIHLLFSANRWEKKQALLTKLQSGVTLIVDRYAYSGVAYSAAKHKPGMDMQWLKAPDVGLPAPDRVLYLQLSPEVSAQRGGYGGERYEKMSFQRKVAEAYEQLKDPLWVSIDADKTPDQVHAQVASEVDKVLQAVAAQQPLLRLWDGKPLQLESGQDDTKVQTAGDAVVQVDVPQNNVPKQQGSHVEAASQ